MKNLKKSLSIVFYYYFRYFNNYKCSYFGNVGTVANQTIVLKTGRCTELDIFPSSMESQLREIGLKLKLHDGKYYLLADFVVCQEGEPLSPEQLRMIVFMFV